MKKGLLIGTLSAAALLVGGTFAAYFVNDAADQKTATIKIKDLTPNDYVTLEWGTDTLQNVEELAPGAEAKVGNVTVKASGKDAEGQDIDADHPYVGYLDLVLDNDLKGHLSVFAKLVQGEEEVAAKGTAITGGMRYEAAVYPEGDKTYAVYVKLDSLGEIGDDLADVSKGEAALSIDWNMGAESTPAEVEPEAAKYYLVGEIAGFEGIGWSVETGVLMDGEPGENNKAAMFNVTLAAGDKFKVHGEGDEDWFGGNPALSGQEYATVEENGNVTIDVAGVYDIYLNNEDQVWVAAHAVDPVDPQDPEEPETVYFLVGAINGAEADWSTTPEGKTLFVEPKDEDKAQNVACLYNVELKAKDEIKAIELTGETVIWHGVGEDNVVIAADGNYDLYLSKDGNLYASKIGAEPEPEPEPEPLTGEHDFYFTNNKNWAHVYAWVANSELEWTAPEAWPGVELAKVDMNEYNQDIYKVTIDCDAYDVVIFNNGAEPADQTENVFITMFGEHDGCYIKEGGNQVGFYDYTPSNND